MPLDLTKLENPTRLPDGNIRARCPACAAEGRDNKGEHLIIFPDGRYGCAAHPGDHKHRQRIYQLVGQHARRRDLLGMRISVRPKGNR